MGRKSAEQLAKEKAAAEAQTAGDATELKETPETLEKGNQDPIEPNTGETIKPEKFRTSPVAETKFVQLRRGEVLVAVLDDKGNEIAGHSFVTTEQTAQSHYNNKTKFSIKKKA